MLQQYLQIMRLKDLNNILESFPNTPTMPAIFVGHGSPMNAIEKNAMTETWKKIGENLPKPTAILCISAHWLSRGTFTTAMENPKTIHDFYGFPKALEQVEYPAAGSPELAIGVADLLAPLHVGQDNEEWGLDHGSWSVLRHIYPNADIPVIEMSIDYTQSMQWHYELGTQLQALRQKGVLLIGSGNIVHNLRMVDWHEPNGGYDWAKIGDEKLRNLISNGNIDTLANYQFLGKEVNLCIPTPDHYIPMLYTLGLKTEKDDIQYFNQQLVMGSLSMTSFILSETKYALN